MKYSFPYLGNVLVCFEVQRVLAQMAAAAGLTRDQVAAALFDHGLQREFELGRIGPEEFFRTFRELTGTKSDLESIRRAATEIFWLNESILPVVSALRQTRRRMGILSNTCITHLEYCRRRFRVVRDCFELVVASCEVGMLKPEPEIYLCAAERAGVAPDIVLSPNDSLALGIAQALDAAGYTPGEDWPILTGQDADQANVLNILAGKQSMSVWKDTRQLGDRVATMISQLAAGEEVEVNDTETYDNGVKVVPSYLLDPTVVVADTVEEILVGSEFYSAEDLGL